MRSAAAAAVVTLVAFSGPVDAAKPSATPIEIDLTKGSVTQSQCKTPVGCAHRNVKASPEVFESTDTSSEFAQHILTLRVDGPWHRSKGQPAGHLALEMGYEIVNPSGTAGNVICATARHKSGVSHDCVRGFAREGRLTLPISSHGLETFWIQFVAMPLARGNIFRVLSPQIVVAPTSGNGIPNGTPNGNPNGNPNGIPNGTPNGTPNGGSNGDASWSPFVLDLQDGALRQENCQVPIGCLHGNVRLGDDLFSSSVRPPPVSQVPPSDNPNDPPAAPSNAGGPLTLELPVPNLKDAQRTLNFDHAMKGPNGTPGLIKLWTIANGKVLRSIIGEAGSGSSSFVIASGSGGVESVFITFEPFAGGSGGDFEVSDVSFGVGGPTGEPLPIETSETCDDCDPPASRLDPCGAFLNTYYVEAADTRDGNGFRCVSQDGHAFYGEGWWNDFDWRYAHLGYFATEPSEPEGVAIDFGLHRRSRRETSPGVFEERDVRYGTVGPMALQREVLSASQLRVTSPSGWNEIWTFVPKGELMPRFVGRMPWDGECGVGGLVKYLPSGSAGHARQVRCALPTTLADIGPAPARDSLPYVWYGAAYIEQLNDGDIGSPAQLERPHLGWLVEVSSATIGRFGAADRCVLPHPSGCRAYADDIVVDVILPDEDRFLLDDRGLGVKGPASWIGPTNSDGRMLGVWWQTIIPSELERDSALEAPTAVCVSDCP
jgi:hypothetical protein